MSLEEDGNKKLLNTIFLGEVATVHNYGAFVKIPGERSQGLIHRSQISTVPVDEASDVLQRGESVWCKVIGITDDNKVSLSMKVVDQGSGKDLDPNGVQIHQDEQRRKNYNPRSKKVIELEAVFNTTCTKCGTRGHLAKDCFKSPGGKTYELLPEDDELPPNEEPQSEESVKEVKSELKKHKKEKKKKKKHQKDKEMSKKAHKHKKIKKRRRSSTELSDSEESPDDREKKRRGTSLSKTFGRSRSPLNCDVECE